ncbi:HU family DNA-binding protein, partial [Bacteroides xylanisolvens]
MSAIYDLFETPSPNKEEKQPLHARIVSKGTVDKEEFLDRVHKFTGISRSLLAGAMEAFANEARDLLADGWNVEMGNFGFFSTSLQCPPVKDKKEIRAASVQMKNINFRASRPFKKEVGDKMRLQRGESITRPKKNSISRE